MSKDIRDKLKNLRPKKTKEKPVGPVWKGPEKDGVTFSLLSRYLGCKERFRLLVMEGLKPADQFSHRLEYGNMWHVCEEGFSSGGRDGSYSQLNWAAPLQDYAKDLCQRYPTAQDQINHWYGVCKTLFLLYVNHWSKHPDVKKRTPLFQEQVFSVTYTLPSGRKVLLRGKWDAGDLIEEASPGIYLQENKAKGDINERQLTQQLTFDLQTMLYVVALGEKQDHDFWNRSNKRWRSLPIRGVRYNVVRRPAHKQGKKETRQGFLDRLAGLVEKDPEHFFMRWKVQIDEHDVSKFKRTCLTPILENLCDDYEWWAYCRETTSRDVYDGNFRRRYFPDHAPRHYRMPYGCYNPLLEGGSSELDGYLDTGSEVGLTRTNDLFPELSGS